MSNELTIEDLINELFSHVTDSVLWFIPVKKDLNTNLFTDYKIRYCNEAAANQLGVAASALIGSDIFSSGLVNKEVLLTLNDVFSSDGEKEIKEYTYRNTRTDTYIHVQKSHLQGGILCISRDCTLEQRAIANQQVQEEKYKKILDTAADGIMLFKAIRDNENNIKDFRLEIANTRAFELGQLPENIFGKTLLDLFPHLKDSEQFELHKKVVETGEPVRFETTFRTARGNEYGWFIVSLTRFGDGVISNFVDVTEKKQQHSQILLQKDLLNKILDSSLGGVITCEAVKNESGVITDFRFIQVNEKFRQMVGQLQVEIIGSKVLELFPLIKKTPVIEKLCFTIESGQRARFELEYPRAKGDKRWYDVSVEKISNQGVVVSFADITQNKKAAIELQTQKQVLDNILRQAANGITLYHTIRNEEGAIVDFECILTNESAERLTGILNSERLSKPRSVIRPEVNNPESLALAVQALNTGEPFQREFYYPAAQKWLEFSIAPMDADHLVEIFTDISSIKEAQLQLQYSINELRQFNQNLEEFTRAASHDLQEPIRKVQFFADRLANKLEGRLDSSEKDLLQRMVNATSRMKLLVDDLLDYAHTNQLQLQPEEVDLNSKLRQVVGDLELMIQEKNAIIHIGSLPVVKGYRRQLQQLFQNLITNSLKYTREDVQPVINITSSQTTGEKSGFPVNVADSRKEFHLFEIQDNGIGFEQKEADRIFNMFTRLHGNTEYTGTGVGLAIVKKVVENHNGYIKAQAQPGQGATFFILLPV
ncbi:MAG: PAS domain-containing protein [Candidatus Dadabacteria bacterium]